MPFNTGRLCSQCWPSLFSQPTSILENVPSEISPDPHIFPLHFISCMPSQLQAWTRKNKQQMTIKLIFMNSPVHHPSFNIFLCCCCCNAPKVFCAQWFDGLGLASHVFSVSTMCNRKFDTTSVLFYCGFDLILIDSMLSINLV